MEQEALAKKDSLLLAEAYYTYGKTYATANDFLTSLHYFMKSLRIQEKRGDSYELGRLYYWLSDNAIRQSNYDEALKYAQISLTISHRVGSDLGHLRAYRNLGAIHMTDWSIKDNQLKNLPKANLDSAYYYFKKHEYVAHKMKDPEAIAESYDWLGGLLMNRNDKRAITYFKASLDIFTHKKKHNTGRINLMVRLAEAYVKFQQYDNAYRTLVDAQKIVDNTDLNTLMLIDFENSYIHYYQAIHKWAQAFVHLERLRELEKKSLIVDRTGAISRLNIEYETQKKEAQLKSQQQEITLRSENERNQQRFLLITLALLLVAVGATAAFYRLYRKNQRISRQNEELVKEQNHRVKNNLQVVSSLLNLQARQLPDAAAKRAVTDSQLRIQSMAILHRRLYDGEELAKVNLPEFIQELVQGVLKTFGFQSITPMFTIDRIHLHADKTVPLGLIINELVANACKYAFPCTDAPTLEISCQQKDNNLQLIVADNGPGFARLEDVSVNGEVVAAKKSFGMKLIKSQAEQLNATYHFEQEGGMVFRMMFKV